MKEIEITAYALNELQKEDRDNFETGLAGDAELQSELHSVTRVADALEQIMVEPAEGLEAGAREQLLRTMAANQEAFRARRRIVRFALPVSLAAAASIAVLLWVAGGTAPQGSAVAAADGGESQGSSGSFAAKISSTNKVFTFRGDGKLSPPRQSLLADATEDGVRIPSARFTVRTISMSESARVAQELRADAGLSLTSPTVRMKPLIWDDDLTRLGGTGQ